MPTTITNTDPNQLRDLILNRPETPDQVKGNVFIEHKTIPKGKKFSIVSARNAIFMGEKRWSVQLDEPLIVRSLYSKKHGKLMSDHPQELWQMREPLKQAYGNVLIGGLGLGIVSHLMSLQDDVDTVTTVELNQDIIDMVKPHIDASYVVTGDIFKYVKNLDDFDDYDFAFFDTWQSTGEYTWNTEVVPLKRLCRNSIETVYCWNEEEMIGQCMMNLPRVADMDYEKMSLQYTFHERVFRRAVVKKKLRPAKPRLQLKKDIDMLAILRIEKENRNDKKLMAFLDHFLRDAGTDLWERNFGKIWDQVEEQRRKEK